MSLKLTVVLGMILVGALSYVVGKMVRAPDPDAPRALRASGPLQPGSATSKVRDRAVSGRVSPTTGGATAVAAEVQLPPDLSPLDQLSLEQGGPALLLRGKVMGTIKEWGKAARTACLREAGGDRQPLDPSEVQAVYRVKSDGASIAFERLLEVAPHNGAPVPESVLAWEGDRRGSGAAPTRVEAEPDRVSDDDLSRLLGEVGHLARQEGLLVSSRALCRSRQRKRGPAQRDLSHARRWGVAGRGSRRRGCALQEGPGDPQAPSNEDSTSGRIRWKPLPRGRAGGVAQPIAS
jgi:hypothetical protein